MKIAEIEKRFATNERRRELFHALEQVIALLRHEKSKFQVVIYGSFVTDKEFPGDIDLLVELQTQLETAYKIKKSCESVKGAQVKGQYQWSVRGRDLKNTPQQLVDWQVYHKANADRVMKIDNYILVEFDSMDS